jgi:hypothetical protein
MRIDELKPGTYFKSDRMSFLYDRSLHIIRCWDGGAAEAGFRAYPNTSVEVISADIARALAREVMRHATLE